MNIDNMFSCQSFLYLSKKATRALDNIPASGFLTTQKRCVKLQNTLGMRISKERFCWIIMISTY